MSRVAIGSMADASERRDLILARFDLSGGRQGKSSACGSLQGFGWIEVFGVRADPRRQPDLPIFQEIQGPKRHPGARTR